MSVVVLLCTLVVPLLVRGGEIDRAAAYEEGNGGLMTIHSQRVDSYQDSSMKVTLYGPFSNKSMLFRECVKQSNTAFVRYHFLKFPGSGVEFTRYIPNAAQRQLYNPNWQDVNDKALNTSLACATYAKKNTTLMMYQFNGTKCRVSTIRMPIRVPTCGDRKVHPVFIRTSCQEPTVLRVTLTPDAGAMNITWTVSDPCNINNGFQVKWANVMGKNTTALNTKVFFYRIKNRFGCETQNVTVTAVDSSSLPWGEFSSASAVTLSRSSPVMATLTVDESVNSIRVSWASDFNECLRINNYVVTWDNGTQTLDVHVSEYNITGLHACQNITVTVKALYDEGSGTTNILSENTRTLPEDPVIENFRATSFNAYITLNWTVRDYCEFTNKFTIAYDGYRYTLTNASRSYTTERLSCHSNFIFILMPKDMGGANIGSGSSVDATNTFTEQRLASAVVGALRNITSHAEYDGISKYSNCMKPSWLITSPGDDTHVRIQFQTFLLEGRWDTVKIYDGEDISAPLLDSLTGYKDPPLPTYTSTGRHLLLIFRTDSTIVMEGFWLLYDAV